MYISSRLIRFSGQSCQFHRAESHSYDIPRVYSCRRCHIFLLLSIGVSMLANQSANKTSGLLICLFCQSLDLNITRVSHFFLSLTWSPPNSLSAAAQPSLYVTQKFFYVLWFMHGCTHIHIFHTFYPLPSIKSSWFRIWPFTSSLLSLPCPSPVSVSARAIVMHMEPTEWVYVWGVQGKCQLTKALRYHEALSILSVFRVTLDSISYFVITVYRHFHCKISIF